LKLKGNEDHHHHHYHPCKRKRTRMNSHAIPNYTYYPKVTKSKSKLLQNPQNPQKNLTPLNPYPIHNHPKRPQKKLQVEIPAKVSPPTNGFSLKRSFHTQKLYLRNNPNDNLGVEALEKLTPRTHPPTKRNEKHKKGTLLLPPIHNPISEAPSVCGM
jgi:hypothetical protein